MNPAIVHVEESPLGAPWDRTRDLFARFLLEYTGATRDAYARDLRDFAEWCARGGIDPLSVTRAHVALYVRSLEAIGRAPTTIGRRLSTLSGVFRYAVEEEILNRSPVDRIPRPKVDQDSSPTLGLDRDEARLLLEGAEYSGPRDHLLVCLLLLNGLRVSEACGADVEDLDQVRGHRVLRVTRKGGKRPQVPLAARTSAAVDDYIDERVGGPLLLDGDGERLDRYDAARVVRRVARAVGITKRISPHSLRHTAVTLSLDAGVSLRDAQDFAGHADPRTTRRYDRGRFKLDRNATYTLASYLAREGGPDDGRG